MLGARAIERGDGAVIKGNRCLNRVRYREVRYDYSVLTVWSAEHGIVGVSTAFNSNAGFQRVTELCIP